MAQKFQPPPPQRPSSVPTGMTNTYISPSLITSYLCYMEKLTEPVIRGKRNRKTSDNPAQRYYEEAIVHLRVVFKSYVIRPHDQLYTITCC